MIKQKNLRRIAISAFAFSAAFLVFVFSYYSSTIPVQIPDKKESNFSVLVPHNVEVSLSSQPVTIPAPAVSDKKSNSSRSVFASKFMLFVTQTFRQERIDFALHQRARLTLQFIRLHLAFSILRI